jgi:hypothetical protein
VLDLKSDGGKTVTFTFAEIEGVIGSKLPKSARTYRPWWANEMNGRYVQAHAWMGAGYRVEAVDLKAAVVTFLKPGH